MFHFSTDRLAGLDTMILKITTPTKVPTLIPNHPLDHDSYRIPARKLRKHKPHTERRTPLADRTASSNLPPRPLSPTSSMPLRSLSVAGEAHFISTKDDPSSPVPDIPSFRPLPPLPSASSLQLPSFLDVSTQSLSSLADPPPRRSSASLPASLLFQTSSPPVAPPHPVSVRETKNKKAFVGPQWIPAFHHPNSPYVPWTSPVRRRILPPPSPLPPSPDCSSSLFVRTGAVAPEPWTSSTFSQVQPKSKKEKLLNSWKSFKSTINKGVKTVVSRLGKARALVGTICVGKDMLSNHDDTDTTAVRPNNAMQSIPATTHSSGPRDSLASFVSSDSATLAAWLAEQHDPPSCEINSTPREMSVAEYELMGSRLNVHHCGGGWACGVRDCDLHSADGPPYSADDPRGLRMAMLLDSADLHSEVHPSPRIPAVPFPTGPFSTSPRFHSLPRFPYQSPNIHPAQEVKPVTQDRVGRCLTRGRELSMPGGWMFS